MCSPTLRNWRCTVTLPLINSQHALHNYTLIYLFSYWTHWIGREERKWKGNGDRDNKIHLGPSVPKEFLFIALKRHNSISYNNIGILIDYLLLHKMEVTLIPFGRDKRHVHIWLLMMVFGSTWSQSQKRLQKLQYTHFTGGKKERLWEVKNWKIFYDRL